MTYISADGSVIGKRSWYRLSIITDIFWGIVDTIGLLGSTLIYPNRPVPRLRRSREQSSGGEIFAVDASTTTELWKRCREIFIMNRNRVIVAVELLLVAQLPFAYGVTSLHKLCMKTTSATEQTMPPSNYFRFQLLYFLYLSIK